MEQKQLKQFTFYDLYWDLIRQSDDTSAGRLVRNICRYMSRTIRNTTGNIRYSLHAVSVKEKRNGGRESKTRKRTCFLRYVWRG